MISVKSYLSSCELVASILRMLLSARGQPDRLEDRPAESVSHPLARGPSRTNNTTWKLKLNAEKRWGKCCILNFFIINSAYVYI